MITSLLKKASYFVSAMVLPMGVVIAVDAQQPASPLSPSIDPQANVSSIMLAKQSYPWVVSLHVGDIENGEDFKSQYCAGVLIEKRWVLTAAHCVDDIRDEDIWAIIGAETLAPNLNNERISVDAIVPHPEYNRHTLVNNIALVRLASASETPPIQLLSKASSSLIEPSSKLKIIGWDSRNDSIDIGRLCEVDAYIQDQGVCLPMHDSKINMGMMCVEFPEGGSNACKRYSGSPLIIHLDDQFYHLGMVGWEFDCCQSHQVVAYTETSAFGDWLKKARSGLAILKRFKPRFVGAEYPYTLKYQVTNHSEEPRSIDYSNITRFPEVDRIRDQCKNKLLQPYEICNISVKVTPGAEPHFDSLYDVEGIEETLTLTVRSYLPEVLEVQDSISTLSISPLVVDDPSTYNMPLFTHSLMPWTEVVDKRSEAVATELHSGLASEELPSMLLTYVEGPGELNLDIKIADGVDSVRLYDNGFLFSEMTDDFSPGEWHSASLKISQGTHLIRIEVPISRTGIVSTGVSLKRLKFVPEE